MRLYFDLDQGRLVTGAGFNTRLNLVEFKRGDAAEIRFGFYRGVTQEILTGTPQLQFALKEDGKYDGDPVVSESSWTLGTSEAMDYVCNPDFNTTELDTLLNSGDADDTNDIEYVDLMLEVTWSEDGGSSWSSTDTVTARVHNDVIKGIEGVPTSGVPTYPTAASLINLTDNITVTQAVDLDAIETRVDALDAAVVLQGTWDASVGTFPGSGTAQAGESWIVSVAGTVDSVSFSVDDRIIAILDNASTATYAANWHKADYSDLVSSVNGATGTVVLDAGDIAAVTDKNYVTDAEAVVIGNTSGTNTGDEVSATDAIEGIVELATQAEVDTGTDSTRVVTPSTLANYSGLGGSSATDTTEGIVELATQAEVDAGTDTTRVVTPSTLASYSGLGGSSATDTTEGIVELATQAEVDAGTDTTRVVTPSTLASYSGLGGDVIKVGTPVNNQIGVWTGDGTLEGDADLTWDESKLNVQGTGTMRLYLEKTTGSHMGLVSGTNNSLVFDEGADLYIYPTTDMTTLAGSADPSIFVEGTTRKVGIANDTPSEALDVTGNIAASGTLAGSNLSGTNTGDESSATTSAEGIVELATQTEVNTGTDSTRVVTPSTLANYTGFGDFKSDGSVSMTGNLNINTRSLVDANSNELLRFDTQASAVNEITIKNNATGLHPQISASGNDATIDLDIDAKGTYGKIFLGSEVVADRGITIETSTATATGTTTIDWRLSTVVDFTFTTSNEVFSFSNAQADGFFVLKLTQDGVGSRTVTWPASVKWPGGTAPTLSTAAGATDIVRFEKVGTYYYGSYDLNYS